VPQTTTYLVNPNGFGPLWSGFGEGFNAIVNGDPGFVYTAEQTALLALRATTIAIVVGLPLGCALGIGRFRGRRALLAVGNTLTRVPPVVAGVVVLLMIGGRRADGSYNLTPGRYVGFLDTIAGPLARVQFLNSYRDVFAQTLLAVPIMIALTATAVQRVAPGLIDQAQAFGAPWWKRGLLALREARTAVIAAVIVSMGVTITAIGALYVVQGDAAAEYRACQNGVNNFGCHQGTSLALGALTDFQDKYPGVYADADGLIIIFFVMAAGLTFIQRDRSSWIAGGQS
jgi:tungstate transport system permease protein